MELRPDGPAGAPTADPDKRFREQLLSALTCPRCREYLEPPIALCEQGHNACGRCRQHARRCSLCGRRLLEARNVSLEAIARDTLFPCRFAAEGCAEARRVGDIAAHHVVCPHRVFPCPWLADRCSWRGPRKAMAAHLGAAHPGCLVPAREEAGLARWDFSQADCFNERSHAVAALGEVFLVDRLFDVPQKKLCLAVRAAAGVARDFRYSLRLERNGGAQAVEASCLVHARSEDPAALFASPDCVKVDFDTIVSFNKGSRTVQVARVQRSEGTCTLLDI